MKLYKIQGSLAKRWQSDHPAGRCCWSPRSPNVFCYKHLNIQSHSSICTGYSWNSKLVLCSRSSQKKLFKGSIPKNVQNLYFSYCKIMGCWQSHKDIYASTNTCAFETPTCWKVIFLRVRKSMTIAFTLCIGSPSQLPREAIAKGKAVTFLDVRHQTIICCTISPYSPQPCLTIVRTPKSFHYCLSSFWKLVLGQVLPGKYQSWEPNPPAPLVQKGMY